MEYNLSNDTIDTGTDNSRSPSRVLAEFAANVPGSSIPKATLDIVEECILDFTGLAAFAANFAESSPAFRQGACQLEVGKGDFTVVGESQTYSALQATILNGAFAHTMDFDDTNIFGVFHPGAPIIPATLVGVEQSKATGREFLEAVTVGYEVASRIGGGLGMTAYDRGFHITSVAGIFGAVAALARLQKLSADVIYRGFGIAGSLASGSMQYLENGAWNKRLHPGFAAHNALLALSFARAGVVSAEAPIEGRFGLLTGYSNDPKPHLLIDRLGEWWAAAETGIKPYPSCRMNHGAVDGALKLRERFSASERPAQSLKVQLAAKAYDLVGEPLPRKLAPENTVDAQFSVYFQLAAAWLDGKVDWESYSRLGAADIEAMARRVEVTIDESLPAGGARITVPTTSGPVVEEILVPSGEPSTPLGRARVTDKFLSLAVPVFGKPYATQLAARLLSLRDEPSAAELVRVLRKPARISSEAKQRLSAALVS